MATNETSLPSISETKHTTLVLSTPAAQTARIALTPDFDDTPVDKSALSLPVTVKPGKGSGHKDKDFAFLNANFQKNPEKKALQLASPIFSQEPQYPALDGYIPSGSEDTVEGIEQISLSESDTIVGVEDPEKFAGTDINVSDSEEENGFDLKFEWLGTSEPLI